MVQSDVDDKSLKGHQNNKEISEIHPLKNEKLCSQTYIVVGEA